MVTVPFSPAATGFWEGRDSASTTTIGHRYYGHSRWTIVDKGIFSLDLPAEAWMVPKSWVVLSHTISSLPADTAESDIHMAATTKSRDKSNRFIVVD